MILSFGRPNAVIASYNVKNDTELSREDITYLTTLSADAAPYLFPLMEEYGLLGGERKSYTFDYSDLQRWDLIYYGNHVLSKSKGRGIRGFNISFMQAEKEAKKWDYQYIDLKD